MPGERINKEQDFRLLIGAEPFDPKDVETRARRQADADGGAGRPAETNSAGDTIVQFTKRLTAPDMARLRAEYDLKLDHYVPNLAFLERITQQTIDRLKGDFLVRACIDLDPALKLAPWIGGGEAALT